MNMRLRTVSLVLLVVLAAVPVFASHSWGGYHWARQSNPFTLKLGDNLTSADWKSHLVQTRNDWNAGNTPVQTTIVAGGSNKRCSMVAGTTQVCNGRYGANGWLGLASINITGGVHITQGSAKMNDTYFDTSTYNNPNEREHVMCQEVAHTFGLGHQSEDGSSQNSCMDYFSNTGANAGSTTSTKPNAHDFSMLNSIYQHLDSTTTVSLMTGLQATVDSLSVPTRWIGDDLTEIWQLGTPIEWNAAGKPVTFVLHGGSDHAGQHEDLLTHVFWAPEDVVVDEPGLTELTLDE